jgi:hypothetical protein
MADITNTFMGGRMEKDLDERLLPEGLYRDALNIDIDISEGANVGSARNKMGNTKIADLATISGQTIQNCRTIGAEKYERDNLIYWLVASDEFDGIYEYNEITGQTVRVLQSNKATPSTASKLNFNQQYIVTGINYINGFLYWTDNYNPPRKINIARAKSYLIDDARIVDDLNVILAPPLQSPTIVLSNDESQSNNISEKFIYFSYRYKYIDGQYSAMSPFSAVSFTPSVFNLDYTNGSNKAMINKYNSADISFQTGGKNVKEIQLLMRDTRNLNVSIIESFNKDKLSLKDNYTHSFKFKNNKTYTVITSEQITRLFDNVPLLAKAQDFVGNRLMYGNYTQFYDITDCNGEDIKINLGLDYLSTAAIKNSPSETFRSDRDYEVGIVYLDSYGRSTTVLTSEDNTVYIPSTKSITANSLKVSIKHKPPCWATNFRVVLKQSKGKYQTIFPLLYYVDGSYRHFLIQPSDRDKFAIGEYVVFKADADGPTLSNKKYKILDLENRDANFLPGGGQLAGLYFKIKVDSSSEFNGSSISAISDTTEGSDYYTGPDNNSEAQFYPVKNMGQQVENPIYYGVGGDSLILYPSGFYYNISRDYRVTIEVESPTTFKYTLDIACGGGWITGQSISSTPTIVDLNSSLTDYITISWNTQGNIITGDRWKINCRADGHFASNYFGGPGIPRDYNNGNEPRYEGGFALLPAYANDPYAVDTPIYAGSVINITCKEDTYGKPYTSLQQFISPARYANIEEWFVESGAYHQFKSIDASGNNVGAASVSFRRGNNYQVDNSNNNSYHQGYIFNDRVGAVRMIIRGYGKGNNTASNNKFNKVKYELILQQTANPTICETDPKEKDTDIYHEISKTYPIKNGLHKVYWDYSDYTIGFAGNTNLGQLVPGSTPSTTDVPHNFSVGDTIYVKSANNTYMPSGSYTIIATPDCYNILIDLTFPGSGPVIPGKISYSQDDQDQGTSITSNAVIKINNSTTKNSDYNAWTFGNGLESDRIYDDWNAPTLEYSPRTNSVVDEYKQKLSENAICYSGVYGINTGINRLNEFNLSIANFKYLDKAFGAIQKLHSRDTDLLVFQYDKISKVLYGKNLLSDAVGGGQVVSIPEVLGTQLAFPYENGISINPESFASSGENLFITDARRGTVLNVAGDSLVEINTGMNDYFRDLMRNSPDDQKLGAYDPHNQMYVLATNDISVKQCKLSLSRNNALVPNYGSGSERVTDLFSIITDSAWTLEVISTGFGTNWVTGYATSGYGSQSILAAISSNTTGANRTVNFIVTYCGQTVTFVLTQGRYKEVGVIIIVDTIREREPLRNVEYL